MLDHFGTVFQKIKNKQTSRGKYLEISLCYFHACVSLENSLKIFLLSHAQCSGLYFCCAQGSLLADSGTVRGARDQTWVGHGQGECPPCYTAVLALYPNFEFIGFMTLTKFQLLSL